MARGAARRDELVKRAGGACRCRAPAALLLGLGLLLGLRPSAAEDRSPSPPLPSSAPLDLVLLLDESASVLRWNAEVDTYLLGPFVRDYLRLGDTVHLLSFGSKTAVDVVRAVRSDADVKAVLAQLFLLYPLDPHTDFLGALTFLEGYLRGLDPARQKLVVIVSDGVQDPPPGSPWVSLDAEGVSRQLEKEASSLRALGWPLRFVMLPFGSDRGALAQGAAAAGGTATPTATAGAGAAAAAAEGTAASTAAAEAGPGAAAAAAKGSATGDAEAGASPSGSSAGSPAGSGTGPTTRQSGLPSGTSSSGGAVAVPGAGVAAADEAARALGAEVTTWPTPTGTATEQGVSGRPAAVATATPPGTAAGAGSQSAPVPPSASPASGAAAEDASQAALGLGLPLLHFPKDLGSKGRSFILPLRIDNKAGRALDFDLLSVNSAGRELLAEGAKLHLEAGASGVLRPRLRLPADIGPGDLELRLSLRFAGELRTLPSEGLLRLRFVESPLLSLLSSPAALIAGGLALFFVVALVLFRLLASLPQGAKRRAAKAMGRAAAPPPLRVATTARGPAPEPERPLQRPSTLPPREVEPPARSLAPYEARVRKSGRVQVEFRVLEQNSHIGRRNVHELEAGQARSVGGGRSDYLIYLVPVPHAVAELHFDGETCVFVPREGRLFPELEGPIEDCLDRDIPMVSPRGYPLTLRFSLWEDPRLRLNRLLHCIEVPGLDWEGSAVKLGEPRKG